jgi:2-cysteine adaptor domain
MILNPATNRKIKIDGPTYRVLYPFGHREDENGEIIAKDEIIPPVETETHKEEEKTQEEDEPDCPPFVISEKFQVNDFKELVTKPELDKIQNWEQYVTTLVSNDPNYTDSYHHPWCYICGIGIIAHTDKDENKVPFEVTFRYKPWKSNWREEDLCAVCYYASQNPLFSIHWENSSYGYPGINKDGIYEDLREGLSYWSETAPFSLD